MQTQSRSWEGNSAKLTGLQNNYLENLFGPSGNRRNRLSASREWAQNLDEKRLATDTPLNGEVYRAFARRVDPPGPLGPEYLRKRVSRSPRAPEILGLRAFRRFWPRNERSIFQRRTGSGSSRY